MYKEKLSKSSGFSKITRQNEMKKIFIISLLFMFSCSQVENKKISENPKKNKQSIISILFSLKEDNSKSTESNLFVGKVNVKSDSVGKTYSYTEVNHLNPYLYIYTTVDGKFISAILYSSDKNLISEAEIKEAVKAEDWDVKSSFASHDDATEKTIVFSVKKNVSYGYYKGMENNKIHFLEIGSDLKPFSIKNLFMY